MKLHKQSEKKIEEGDTGPKIEKRTSEKISRSRKTEEKSEKTISSYSIKKERRILSISQPTKLRK